MTYPVTCIPLVVMNLESSPVIVHNKMIKNFGLGSFSEAQASKKADVLCSRGKENISCVEIVKPPPR